MWDEDSNEGNELCLIDHGVRSLRDIPLVPSLQVINLHSNLIERIENLQRLRHLKHLDLSSNRIRHIEGTDALVCLRTLNLACNQIQVVEGLRNLRALVKLNVAYNQIHDLSGLQIIQGPDYRLSQLELHGNQLTSLPHICRCIKGCQNLRHLILNQSGADNPVCSHSDYRPTLLRTLPLLTLLDGVNRDGKSPAVMQDVIPDIPGLEQYMDFLLTSSSSDLNPIARAYPRISAAVEAFHHRGATTPEITTENDTSHQDTSSYSVKMMSSDDLATEHEKRLKKLENQLANLLSTHDSAVSVKSNQSPRLRDQQRPTRDIDDTDQSDDYDSGKQSAQPTSRSQVSRARAAAAARSRKSAKKLYPEKATNLSRAKSGPSPQRKQNTQDTAADESSRDDVRKTYVHLMKELEDEREKRWKSEMAAKKLAEQVQALRAQASEEKELQTVAVDATSRLKQILAQEREEKMRLQAELEVMQEKLSTYEAQVERLRDEQEDTREALQTARDTAGRAEREGLQQQAHMAKRLQESELRSAALAREVELLKAGLKTSKQQVQQLQELLANREQEHRKELEHRYALNSPELQEAMKKEVKRIEELHAQDMHNQKQKIESLTKQYVSLEDEFREALTSEESRFKQVQKAFETVSRENATNKQALLVAKEKDDKSTSVIAELTAMIKEQKGRIAELTKAKQEQTSDMKERIHAMEAQLDEARRRMVQLELLKKENVKLQSQIQGQESVIEGLKAERRLWGEELAQQGASLAQDRGRLEAKIETLNSDLISLKRNLERETDSVKIKTKMIEDQTETIRKLKNAVVERDEEIRKAREEALKIQRELEEQLATESAVNTDIQEQNDRLKLRKDELKAQVSELEDKLEESQNAHRSLSKKWQEKSGLIGQLEKQVMQMKEGWGQRESKMIEERDRAIEAASAAVEKLRSADDAFREQLDAKEESHQRALRQLEQEKQREIDLANRRVIEVEEEMRELLRETESSKKQMEDKLKRLQRAFSDLHHDLI